MRLLINGKFTAQRLTGVQRVAEELVRALDARPDAAGAVLLLPPQGRRLGLSRIRESVIGPSHWPLHVWEQVVLPRFARGGVLLNLAGAAPAFGGRQVCLLHDAAVFDAPGGYTFSFICWYRWLFRRMARHAETLLTVSEFSKAQLANALCVDPDRFTVLPNGADHLNAEPAQVGQLNAVLSRHGLSCGGYFLAVGSANPNKNLSTLFKAHASLPVGRLPLVLVGGSDPGVFASVAMTEESDVRHLGVVDDELLRLLYLGARGLVFPSLYEGFGLPPLEAMATGCAVIASTAGSLPEICAGAALYVDPGNVAELAAAMHQLSQNDALRNDLISAGRVRAATFRWKDSAQRLASSLALCGVKV